MNRTINKILTVSTTAAILATLGAGQAKAVVIDFSQTKGLDDFATAQSIAAVRGTSTVRFTQTVNDTTSTFTTTLNGTTTITDTTPIPTSPTGGSIMVSEQDSNIAGDYRVLSYTSLSGLSAQNRSVTSSVGGGTLFIDNGSNVNGDVKLWYDGDNDKTFDGATGTLGYDFTKNANGQSGVLTGVWIELVSSDLGLDNLTLEIYGNDGTLFDADTDGTKGNPVIALTQLGVDTNNPLVDQTGKEGFYFDFVQHFGGTISDFTAIKSLKLTVDSKIAGDSEISFLGGSLAPVETIPESDLSWLTLAGLTVVGALSFKRKSV